MLTARYAAEFRDQFMHLIRRQTQTDQNRMSQGSLKAQDSKTCLTYSNLSLDFSQIASMPANNSDCL